MHERADNSLGSGLKFRFNQYLGAGVAIHAELSSQVGALNS